LATIRFSFLRWLQIFTLSTLIGLEPFISNGMATTYLHCMEALFYTAQDPYSFDGKQKHGNYNPILLIFPVKRNKHNHCYVIEKEVADQMEKAHITYSR